MKYIVIAIMMVSACCSVHSNKSNDNFQLILEPHWQPFEPHAQHMLASQDEWILVGSITFKKKAKENVQLARLNLQWKGPAIDTMFGSLYVKKQDKDFLPLQDNLICDGSWNKTQQTLKLTFDQQRSLGSVNVFYLVLTIPKHAKPALKKGSFEIVATCLPEPFRPTSTDHKLLLSLDALDTTITTKD